MNIYRNVIIFILFLGVLGAGYYFINNKSSEEYVPGEVANEAVNKTEELVGSRDGTHFGFIHGVDVEKGEIQFDNAVWLSGVEGEEAAIKAGHCTKETRFDCLPNDYFISNSLERDEVLSVDPSVVLFMKTWEVGNLGILDREIGFSDFAKLISDKSAQWDMVPYNVTIENGKVIHIEEVYVP